MSRCWRVRRKRRLRSSNDGLKPRLILSDIVMTGMTGLALLDHVRERHAEIPIVMVSGVSDVAVAIGTLRNGAYDYLLKPFERDQLLGTVLRALEYRALVEQNNVYRTHLEELVAARTEMLNSAIGDLERSYDITLEALGDALDLKDTETEGHSRRVTAYTIALARAMQLPPQEIRTMARGAFLHDVGKMAIPDAILLKPGRLTLDEQSTMREHCERGYQMLRKIPYLREAAEIVYSHQEHFNGRGIRGGCGETRSRWEQGSSPWRTRWMQSPPTGRTAAQPASRRHAKRSARTRERSSILRSWMSFCICRTVSGKTCARKSRERHRSSIHSRWER